jgi:hypothetical protein
LFICRKAPYLLKVVIMSLTQTQPLPDRAALCRERIEQCDDIIRELQEDIPAGCRLTFSIEKSIIAGIDIAAEGEKDFMLAFFTGWQEYYKKELRRLTGRSSA